MSLAYATSSLDSKEPDGPELVGTTAAIGAVFLASAIRGFYVVDTCNDARAEAVLHSDAARARAMATWKLVNDAVLAARHGDCDGEVKIAHQIESLDPVARRALLLDQAVQHCGAPPPVEPAVITCFDEVTRDNPAHVCLPTAGACERARALLVDVPTTGCAPAPQ